MTRAHVARYLLDKGYIKSISEAFKKYIGDGCPCNVPREMISPQEAIALIHHANGKAVLAHPVLYHMSDDTLRKLISDCKACGLEGIEVLYSTYKPADEHYIKSLGKEFDLKFSGGSDFHGSNKPDIRLGSGRGNLSIPYSFLEGFR